MQILFLSRSLDIIILRERLNKSRERLNKSRERHNVMRERLIKSSERHNYLEGTTYFFEGNGISMLTDWMYH